MTSSQSNLRTAIVAVLLLTCALFLQFRARIETVPKFEPLDHLPQMAGWSGRDLGMSDDVRAVLGAGNFLTRSYFDLSDPGATVGLFIAYFPSQRTGSTMHSPLHCLPGAGWVFTESRRTELAGPRGQTILANEYVISKGREKQFVLYWYQAHGRGVASEYWAKFYLVADAIRMNRTDGALVRITSPFRPGEDISGPRRRANAFASQLMSQLNRFIPE